VSGPEDDVPPHAGDLLSSGAGAAPSSAAERYVLRLFVTGMTPRSCQAIRNLQAICDECLEGRYDLDVIDIYQQPALTKGEQIIAAPTLIKQLPLPMRRLVGDMSNRERVLRGLDLVTVPVARR
jgi:circadian clock protein KaiB